MSAFTNSSRKLHFKAGSATDIGGGRENQDEFFIWENKSIEALAICVLDGHGREVGKIAANAARAAIVDFLTESSDRILKDPSAILIEAHDIAHRTIKKSFVSALETLGNQVCESEEGYLMKRKTSAEGWTCVHGGTSCTIVLIAQMNIYVANVGDSTAAIFSVQPILKRSDLKFVVDAADLTRLNIGAEDPDNNTNFLVISAEHSPESASEFCRLRHFRPNENDPKYPAIQVVYDVCNHNKRSCAQVFNPNITPLKPSGRGNYYKNIRREWASLVATPSSARFQDALAFTRSLGDLHLHTYGITHLPEINRIDLETIIQRFSSEEGSHRILCVVAASDGVWDNWQYEDVGKFVVDSSCLNAVANDVDGAQKVAQSFISRNALLSSRNFGSQADNATFVGLYIVIDPEL